MLLEELALARDVAAVALGDHVLAAGLDRLAGDDAPADRGLDGHVEQLARDELAQLLGHAPPVLVSPVAMHDGRERVDGDAVEQDVDLGEVGAAIAGRLVVEARVSAGAGLQLVEVVEHDLGQREVVDELDPVLGQVLHLLHLAAARLRELHERADVLRRRQHRDPDVRLLDRLDLVRRGHRRRVVDDLDAAVGQVGEVLDVRGRGDEVDAVLALEALTDDLHVQEAEEPATEAEAERARRLGLVGERRVVEPQLLERVPEVGVGVAVDGIQAAEDHGLRIAVPLERSGGMRRSRHGLADTRLADVLDAGDQVTDFSGAQARHRRRSGQTDADLLGVADRVGLEVLQPCARHERAVEHPHRADDTAVRVVVRVEDQRLQRRVGIAFRGRDAVDDCVEQLGHALAGLGRDAQDVLGGDADHALDLTRDAVGLGDREVDLVDGGNDGQVVLDREVRVRQRLRLDALRRVDQEHDTLTGRQAP